MDYIFLIIASLGAQVGTCDLVSKKIMTLRQLSDMSFEADPLIPVRQC